MMIESLSSSSLIVKAELRSMIKWHGQNLVVHVFPYVLEAKFSLEYAYFISYYLPVIYLNLYRSFQQMKLRQMKG